MNATSAPVGALHNRIAAIADDLTIKGWSHQPGLMPPELTEALRAELVALDAAAELEAAGIGRQDALVLDRDIRKARITWMDGESAAQRAFLDWAETFRLHLNIELFLGLFELEASFAVYPPGGFYELHVDSFRGARNRIVSLVVYLNADWDADHGGALAIFAPESQTDAEPVARFLPLGGDAVFMMSEDVPHAIEPTRAKRLAIAAWWRLNQSGAERVDPLD